MGSRLRTIPRSLRVAALLVASGCGADDTAAVAPPPGTRAPAWMVRFDAAKGATIGLDEGDLRAWIETTHRGAWPEDMRAVAGADAWDRFWDDQFLLQTPEIRVDVAEYALSRYEVTNAQWARFLDDRTDTYVTRGDETQEQLALELWDLRETQRADSEAVSAAPAGTRGGDDVTLSAFLPYLDGKGEPRPGGAGVRLTFTVRYVPHVQPRRR